MERVPKESEISNQDFRAQKNAKNAKAFLLKLKGFGGPYDLLSVCCLLKITPNYRWATMSEVGAERDAQKVSVLTPFEEDREEEEEED